ncbi:MAG: alanine racemase [Kiritimatiellae bacterium]|nr:alanine racemase [Kiritimatiellia bacterium]
MSTLRLLVDLGKITGNARKVLAICRALGMDVMGVTKGVCGTPRIVRAMLQGGVKILGDARLDNIIKMRSAGMDAPLMLIRSPAPREVADCVAYADGSLNGDIGVLRALSAQAVKAGKTHAVILMADLNTGREGFSPDELPGACRAAAALENLTLRGIGLYLVGCRSPDDCLAETPRRLVALASEIEKECGIKLPVVSGGSTNVFGRILKGKPVAGVNQLRIGTAILLGLVSSVGPLRIDDFEQDTFILEATLIEVKRRNNRCIGILSLGTVDAPNEFLFPVLPGVRIVDATSDHAIVDLAELPRLPHTGDTIAFHLGYPALCRLMASSYIHLEYRD